MDARIHHFNAAHAMVLPRITIWYMTIQIEQAMDMELREVLEWRSR